jgi:hypothetical protein
MIRQRRERDDTEVVIAGLVPAISLRLAPLRPLDRDGRNKSGHDGR